MTTRESVEDGREKFDHLIMSGEYTEADISRVLTGTRAYHRLWDIHTQLQGYEQLTNMLEEYCEYLFCNWMWKDELLGFKMGLNVRHTEIGNPTYDWATPGVQAFTLNALSYMAAYLVITTPPSCALRDIWLGMHYCFKQQLIDTPYNDWQLCHLHEYATFNNNGNDCWYPWPDDDSPYSDDELEEIYSYTEE